MPINFNYNNTQSACQTQCPSTDGCPPNRCPDFTIRRHDTKPPFKVSLEDCDGPMDLQGLVVEVNMWALAKIKKAITPTETSISLVGNIGFEQVMVGDIILFDRVRVPEYMLITGFDEDSKTISVERGYRNTTPGNWKKGSVIRMFRIMNAPAQTEFIFEDIQQVDGTTLKDELTGAFAVYDWSPEDTCVPGCFWLEFKLIKMKDLVVYLPGGHWIGPINKESGVVWTGSTKTDSSVFLSYDGVYDRFMLPTSAWTTDYHLGSDNSFYTGLTHNDGSVLLNRDDKSSSADVEYNNLDLSTISVIDVTMPSIVYPTTDPSAIIDPSQRSYYYGCLLGEGVEWIRRVPVSGEGFLIKVENSHTPEY